MNLTPGFIRNYKISKSKNAVILSKIIFVSLKKIEDFCNMPAIFVQSFRLIAEKLLEWLLMQTCYSTLA